MTTLQVIFGFIIPAIGLLGVIARFIYVILKPYPRPY